LNSEFTTPNGIFVNENDSIIYIGNGFNSVNYFQVIHFSGVTSIDNNNDFDFLKEDGMILSPNYPNPFNPETVIKFELLNRENVEVAIFNINGEKLEVLSSGFKDSGTHKISFNASNYPSGSYLINLSNNKDVNIQRKIILTK